ncbi:MAG: M28 family metallopeptidase [Halieaceae bacterium]
MKNLSVLLCIAFAVLACTQEPPAASPSLLVDPVRLQAHIEFLASDNLRGRDTGSVDYHLAAEYVASEFRQLGLTPAGDEGSFFQQVPLLEHRLVEGSASAVLHTEAGDIELEYPTQYIMGPDRMVPEQSLSGEMVFVGYGIVTEEFDHDDYAGLDVDGKIVVVLDGRPKAWPTEEGSHIASSREKVRYAAERGAIGYVTLHTPRSEQTFAFEKNFKYLDLPGMSFVDADGVPDGYWQQIKGGAFLNLDAAALLFADAPQSIEEIYQADNEQQAISGFVLPGSLSLSRKSSFRRLQSPNVVAIIEGSDPELKNEYLVYSAHLDHLGVIANSDGDEEIYNGALDNAAGVATLLETARVLNAERDQLKRSVMFVTVTGEEKGLLGAGYYAANPTVPIDSLVANINLDMPLFIYPFADVVAFGAEHSTLKAFVGRAAERAGIKLSPDPMPEQGLFTRSDHYRFVRKGVPAVFLVTGFESKNPEPSGGEVFQAFIADHYHQPSDNTDLPIDYAAGALFTEININIGREVCKGSERPRWNPGDFFGRTFAGIE